MKEEGGKCRYILPENLHCNLNLQWIQSGNESHKDSSNGGIKLVTGTKWKQKHSQHPTAELCFNPHI